MVGRDATEIADASTRPGVPARARSLRAGRSASSGCSRRRRSRAARSLLAAARLLVGAAFLGVVSDAMLLGHWYLVQPGLRRDPVKELVRWTAIVWPFEIAVFLWPTGMVQVLNGTVDDGYNGMLGWIWIACAVTTIGLVGAHVVRAEGALLLGGDGRDRPAVPRDPHRLRHRPRRPRRPVRNHVPATFAEPPEGVDCVATAPLRRRSTWPRGGGRRSPTSTARGRGGTPR